MSWLSRDAVVSRLHRQPDTALLYAVSAYSWYPDVGVNAERVEHGEPPIEFGIGLHCRTVMYGNIGTPDRIAFTVIGKAANEAARIEALCKELNETILVSDKFAEFLDRPWRSHGTFELRNIGRPIEILSPQG